MRVQHILAAAAAALTYSTSTSNSTSPSDSTSPSTATAPPVSAAKHHKHPLVPDYEVKALLNASAVLGPDNMLSHSVLRAFELGTDIRRMHIQFLDTDTRELYEHGWSPRIRRRDDDDDGEGGAFELTYKRRYPVQGYEDGIDAVLRQAERDGFCGDGNYAPQIEWGYTKLTLSLTLKKSASSRGYTGIQLPDTRDARKMLSRHAPGKFVNWSDRHWGTNTLAKSRIFGPIATQRSTGKWNGVKVHVEVWPIKTADGAGTEYLVEASFKVDDRTEASRKHDELIAFLQDKGWFLAMDSLKSRLIMDRY